MKFLTHNLKSNLVHQTGDDDRDVFHKANDDDNDIDDDEGVVGETVNPKSSWS